MADPAVSASPAAHVAAADSAKVTEHPIRKFKHAVVGMLKFWPFWVIALLIVVIAACVERAGKGAITNLVPYLGRKAQEHAAGIGAAALPGTATVVMQPTATVVESDRPPA